MLKRWTTIHLFCYLLNMIGDLINNVSRLIFSDNKQKLVIVYKDLTTKEFDMTRAEYDEMIKTGDFSIIKNG